MGSRNISVLFMISSLSFWTSTVSAAYLTQLEQNTLKEKGITLEDYSNDYWLFKSNGIPSHITGEFPNENNPNTISEQNYEYLIPKNPVRLDTDENSDSDYECLGMGVTAFASNGVPLFNPYSAEGFNAVEGPCSEVFDDCNAHPDMLGRYHYHQFPNCLYDVSEQYSRLYGVALDGFPIYGPYEVDGTLVDESKLDECHGRTAEDGRYEYRITFDFPYILGCYRGKPGSQLGSGSGLQGGSQMYPGSGSGSRPQGGSQMYSGMGSGVGAHNSSQMYSGSGSGSGPQGGNQMYSGSGSGSGPQEGSQISGSGSRPQGGNQMYSGSGSGSGLQGGNQISGSGSGPQGGNQMYSGSGSGSGPQGGSQISGSGSGPQGGNQMYSGWGSGSGPQGGNQISGSGSGPQGGNHMYSGSGSGSGSQVGSQNYFGSGSGSGQQSGSQMYSGSGSGSGPQGGSQNFFGSGSGSQSSSQKNSGPGSGFGPQVGSQGSSGTGQRFGGSGSGSSSSFSGNQRIPPSRRVSTGESEVLAALLKALRIDGRSNRVRRSLGKYYQSGSKGQLLAGLRQLLNQLASTKRADSSCVKDENWMQQDGVCPLKCENPSLGCD